MVTNDQVLSVLKQVMDPELPINIVDLGMVEKLEISEEGIVDVFLTPTFSGCPALDYIQNEVKETIAAKLNVNDCKVHWSFAVQWNPDLISIEGRKQLLEYGIHVPELGKGKSEDDDGSTCPYCASKNVEKLSHYGPSLCRSIFYCNECRIPFEHMKCKRQLSKVKWD
jgi:ring-1,2-phenylacetyl-CoA epoxidase subunit PaaD